MRKSKKHIKLFLSLFLSSLAIGYPQAILCVDDKVNGGFQRLSIHQSDPYDEASDLPAFIKKLRISDFSVSNKLNHPVKLTVEYVRKDQLNVQDQKAIIESQNLKSMETLSLKREGFILSSIDFLNKQPQQYLNPKFPNGKLDIYVENLQDKRFFHQKRDFIFQPRLFDGSELNVPYVPDEERRLREDFNGSYNYIKDAVVRDEGVPLANFYEKRQILYNRPTA